MTPDKNYEAAKQAAARKYLEEFDGDGIHVEALYSEACDFGRAYSDKMHSSSIQGEKIFDLIKQVNNFQDICIDHLRLKHVVNDQIEIIQSLESKLAVACEALKKVSCDKNEISINGYVQQSIHSPVCEKCKALTKIEELTKQEEGGVK